MAEAGARLFFGADFRGALSGTGFVVALEVLLDLVVAGFGVFLAGASSLVAGGSFLAGFCFGVGLVVESFDLAAPSQA